MQQHEAADARLRPQRFARRPAAWIVEKRRTWSDCDGDVERASRRTSCYDDDALLGHRSYGTSARYYYEATHDPWRPSHDRKPVVEAPTGDRVVPRDELPACRRKWAERYYNLQQLTAMPRGGHFAPMEEPEPLVEDIRKFFRTLR